MKIKTSEITITLENDRDIDIFWNIVAFALDLQAERTKKGEGCMTDEELEMAKKLYNLTNKN